MPRFLKALGLLLLLLAAQQGAVVHELGHALESNRTAGLPGEVGLSAGAWCAACPAFAQVVTPAFSHRLHIPLMVRARAEPTPAPPHAAVDAEVPRPRSRGPPTLS